MSQVVRGKEYCRASSLEQRDLQAKFFDLYGLGENSWVWTTCSGTNALAIVVDAVMQQARVEGRVANLFVSSLLFEGSIDFFGSVKERGGKIFEFDPTSVDQTSRLLQDAVPDLVFLESCSNPDGRPPADGLLDLFPAETIVVVDNTWLSPTAQPFRLFPRADFVMESCAKYISGNMRIMGVLAGRPTSGRAEALAEFVDSSHAFMGIHVAPQSCASLLADLEGLQARIDAGITRTRECVMSLETRGCQVSWSGHHGVQFSSCVFLLTSLRSFEEVESRLQKSALVNQTSYGKAYDSVEMSITDLVRVRVAVGFQTPAYDLASELLKIL
jgi:cystathionine beta-lyase/cystathionine gamma-synthase